MSHAADLAVHRIDDLIIVELQIDDAIAAEVRRGDARFRIQRDEAVAGRHVQDALVPTVGPVRQAPTRQLPRRACYTRPRMIKFGRPVSVDVETHLPRLVEALTKDDRIEAVWLFGSRARGEADALSDVDLGVLAKANFDASSLWDAELEWTGVAVEMLGTDEVAVQALNRLPVALRDPILRDARLLWSRSAEIAADFVAMTLKEYLDFKPYLERYDRDLFLQAATGTLR